MEGGWKEGRTGWVRAEGEKAWGGIWIWPLGKILTLVPGYLDPGSNN